MIIKIDVEDGITKDNAMSLCKSLINMNSQIGAMALIDSDYGKASARITQISKAGNIFIKVTKV